MRDGAVRLVPCASNTQPKELCASGLFGISRRTFSNAPMRRSQDRHAATHATPCAYLALACVAASAWLKSRGFAPPRRWWRLAAKASARKIADTKIARDTGTVKSRILMQETASADQKKCYHATLRLAAESLVSEALTCFEGQILRMLATNDHDRRASYDDLRPAALPSGNCIVRTIPCPSFTKIT